MRYAAVTLLFLLTSCSGHSSSEGVPLQPPPSPLAAWKPSLDLADKVLASGAPAVALHITDELLAKNPRNAGALVRRGDALVAMDRRAEAAVSYSASIDIEPRNSRALIGLGRVRLSQDPAAAEALFVRVKDGDAIALNDLGVARDMQGHHAAAQEAYRLALEANPASVPAQANLGLSLALSGNAEAATRLLQPLAAAPDAAPSIRHDLALAMTLNGQRDKAALMLGRDLNPGEVGRALDGFEALRL